MKSGLENRLVILVHVREHFTALHLLKTLSIEDSIYSKLLLWVIWSLEIFDVNPGRRRAHMFKTKGFVRFSYGPEIDALELGLKRIEEAISG